MSFYGSVYYQLIDTFYKAVLRNKGKDKKTFIDTNQIPDSVETPAVGRKGVFGFDTGNRWINLNVVSEEKPESNELYSIYEIYHGAPDENANNLGYGFNLLLDKQVIQQDRTDEEGIIQLEFHDEFETYNNIYDDAGHIAESERKIYRLPKAEVNDDVKNLKRLVGTDANRQLPEMENEEDQNLYGYVEENTKDIQTLESYIGDWSKVVSYWTSGDKWAPTIADTIGNLEDMYESASDRYSNHKTFTEIIGKLAGLKQVSIVKDGVPHIAKNIIEAIVIEKERLDTLYNELNKHQNSSNGAFEGIYSMIGEKIDNDKNIYGHIRQLYSDDDVIRNQLNWSQRPTTTVSGELDSHDLRIKNLEDYRTTLDNTTLPAITGRVGTLEDQTKEHYDAWAKAEDKFEEAHKDIYAKLGTVPEGKNIIGIIDAFRKDVSATFGQIPTDSNVMSEIQSVEDLIGTVPENSDVMSELISSIDSVIDLIGEIPEESSVSAELTSIQKEVDDLEGIVGAVPKENTAYGLISTNANDITEIKEHMGDKVDGKTLSARISENTSSMSTLVTTTLPTNYVSKTELASANYATISDVEKVETALVAITGDLANIETLKANAINSEVALLQDIFDRLVALEADVKSIKETLNPSPDNPESGGDDSGTEVEPAPEEGTE